MNAKVWLGRVVRVSAVLALAGACGGGEDGGGGSGAICGAGDTRACLGPGQCSGAQPCLADGSGYAPCDCGGSADGGGGSGAAGAGGGSGGSGATSGGAGASGGGGASGSSGSGGAPAPCPDGRGPGMVRVGSFCIDTTEVTQGQYAAFLADKAGDLTGQRADCQERNVSYAPTDDGSTFCRGQHHPDGAPDKPANCVDWCDAWAFCTWAGKRLCGAVEGGPVPVDLADPTVSEWHMTCTQGGTSRFCYGSDWSPYLDLRCTAGTPYVQPVPSAETCRGGSPPYDQIYDLTGNVAEFVDIVEKPFVLGTSAWWNYAYGGSHRMGGDGSNLECTSQMRVAGWTGVDEEVGFRCCAD